MTDHIDAFPQRKPSIREIVMDVGAKGAEADLSSDAIVIAAISTIMEHYPDMTQAHIESAVAAEVNAWAARLDEADFWDDLDDAVVLDPDWYVGDDGSMCCRPGALYDTSQKLVAAYRAWIGKTGR
jgi:hypothetical protein